MTNADAFRNSHELQDEIFGASSLVVRCSSLDEMLERIESLEGQLTSALHIDQADYADAKRLLPALERRTGRILVNGFGTGVEVGHAMVHGGPYPSTADGRSTSVGSLAINLFEQLDLSRERRRRHEEPRRGAPEVQFLRNKALTHVARQRGPVL
ncbi:fatty aldehyde dehydrogenase [Caballeronia calidae]|uniref:Fatty aldehyde dehydrogenase n=1 Tax=Caballeronia calidae TaxID=1777139 RepID=A0A158DCE2_9BURK|nr:fatty aldehyde dehydrogenase [Caballeronia calidae]